MLFIYIPEYRTACFVGVQETVIKPAATSVAVGSCKDATNHCRYQSLCSFGQDDLSNITAGKQPLRSRHTISCD